jgi:hypothetical protein
MYRAREWANIKIHHVAVRDRVSICSIIRVLGIALFVVPGYPRDP